MQFPGLVLIGISLARVRRKKTQWYEASIVALDHSVLKQDISRSLKNGGDCFAHL